MNYRTFLILRMLLSKCGDYVFFLFFFYCFYKNIKFIYLSYVFFFFFLLYLNKFINVKYISGLSILVYDCS